MKKTITDEQLRRLFKIDANLNRIQDLDILLEEVLRGARLTANAEAGSIYILEDGRLPFKYSQNEILQRELPSGQKLPYREFSLEVDNKTIAGYCALKGKILNIPDAYKIPPSAPYSFNSEFDRLTGFQSHSMLVFPLKTNTGAVIGVLQLINARNARGRLRTFTADDEQLVSHFSSGATLAIQRAQLTRTMIIRMTQLASLWDEKETSRHVNRVAGYATEIYRVWASRRGLPARQIAKEADVLRMAAMVHDLGKVGIPPEIMKKPGRLTPEEFEVMKGHAQIGANLFKDSQSEFDVMAKEVALTHHEKWDGTGYPRKLSGEAIPIWGRLTALADVFDALSCRRVYKPAWEQEAVYAEIRKQSGVQFDPELVEIFFEVLPNLRQIYNRYPEEPETEPRA